MKLEVGKQYVTASGEITSPLTKDQQTGLFTVGGKFWFPTGECVDHGNPQLKLVKQAVADADDEAGWMKKKLAEATRRIDELERELAEARNLAVKYRNVSCDTQEDCDNEPLPWEKP